MRRSSVLFLSRTFLLALALVGSAWEVLPLVAFLWAALVIQWGVPTRVGRWLLPVSGLLAGAGVLVKFNEGVVALVLVGTAAWWISPFRWRAVGICAGAALAGVVVPWIAMGNGLAGLPDWILSSTRMAAGYSAGLPYEDITRGWEYPLFIGAVGVVAWFAWQEGDAPRGPGASRSSCLACSSSSLCSSTVSCATTSATRPRASRP